TSLDRQRAADVQLQRIRSRVVARRGQRRAGFHSQGRGGDRRDRHVTGDGDGRADERLKELEVLTACGRTLQVDDALDAEANRIDAGDGFTVDGAHRVEAIDALPFVARLHVDGLAAVRRECRRLRIDGCNAPRAFERARSGGDLDPVTGEVRGNVDRTIGHERDTG